MVKRKKIKLVEDHAWKKPYKSLHAQMKKHTPVFFDAMKFINGVRIGETKCEQ